MPDEKPRLGKIGFTGERKLGPVEAMFPVKCGVKSPTKVAIVGFAQTSNHLAPYDDPEYEIWGLNEEYGLEILKTSDGLPRWDRWFQLHPRWDFARMNNANDPQHFEWLKLQRPPDEGGFPIYMQQHWDDIPASVRFPIEPLIEYSQGGIDGKEGYYTNTISYLLAFAKYLGFKRVEIYGVEMASGTEWDYQRPNLEYHVGMARAHGVEVIFPEVCRLVTARLYGWEVSRMIARQELEFRLGALKKAEADEIARLNVAVGKRMTFQSQLGKKKPTKKEMEQLQEYQKQEILLMAHSNAIGGARQEVERLIIILDQRYRPGEEPDSLPFPNLSRVSLNTGKIQTVPSVAAQEGLDNVSLTPPES